MCFTNVNEAGIRYRYFMYSINKCTDFNKNITLKKKIKKYPISLNRNPFFLQTCIVETRNVCITKYDRLYKLSNGKEIYL